MSTNNIWAAIFPFWMIARPSSLKGRPNFSNVVKERLEHKIGLLSRGSVELDRVIMLIKARKAKLKRKKNT